MRDHVGRVRKPHNLLSAKIISCVHCCEEEGIEQVA